MIQSNSQGFPGGTSNKEPACQNRRHKRLGFDPWVGGWLPTPVFLPGESHHQRSLAGCSLSIGSQRVRHDSSDLADMHARPNKV